MPSEHSKYGDGSFFTFRVQDTLFQVPVRQLKQSKYFLSMIDEVSTELEPSAGRSKSPIFLSEVSALEMEAFLTALGAPFLLGDPKLSFHQWAAALHLATLWSFDYIRDKITGHMDNIIDTADPLDQIDASLKCRVEKWLHPAYEALCTREGGLTEDEAERLGFRRATAIWRIRETLRSRPAPQPSYKNTYPYSGFPQQYMTPPASSGYQDALPLIQKEEALKYS
ncbi:hypothetical protein FRC01_013237 [Tulasnella sp. 417]|nr:hypothetical protein FRC01_013237 [Tulasnella sp. 417]